ncbi:nickel/cobalt transporter [Arcobacter sp. FWKO B]|uniref:nickel/cobalt transporter n=1 Tax=Arcobacter sp. FWKO B TaxID=2593672 RepID=UPI0019035B39|nr:hypothetical protein [Arcobacter sp. FWKO B]
MIGNLWGEFIYNLNNYQKILNANIASSFRQIDELGLYGSLIIIAIAFAYGAIHAAGPGHGKAIVASYFLSHGKKISSAFKIGYMVSIIHAFSALVLTFVIYYLIDGVFSKTFNQSVDMMYKISGGLILLVGIYLLYELKKDWNRCERDENISNKKPFFVALSVGIVPCPGVMTVLLFSLMLGHLITGIFATIAMSIGMGLTISIAGILALKSSKLASKSTKILKILQIISPILVISIGLFLLV